MKLSAEMIEAFSGAYLSPRYDQPQPTPQFHRDCWTRYCSSHPSCATAAPRNHAKSTALTHDFILANACFRVEDYIILVGSSEEMAIEHLGDIANEFRENEDLIRDFKIKGFVQEQKTDIIVECTDGYQFRIVARGAEQKIRGRKWKGKRPGLIVGDDLEDDEQVENKDRRKKFSKWFFRACKQALRDGGRIRVHGTILHFDSLLNHLIKNKSWNSKCYRAHRSFQDFSDILWPEKFPEARLRAIQEEFINEGDSAGYSQEYLNDPHDNDDAFLRDEQFLPMSEEDHAVFKVMAVGCDFAVSKQDAANRTSFTIGGKDISNMLHIVENRSDRWDSEEWVDEMFAIHAAWSPEVFYVEDGVIWKAVWPMIRAEMRKRDIWLNFEPILPVKDKRTRALPLQKRMKARGCRFDTQGSWFAKYKQILLLFTGVSEALEDDELDSTAILAKGIQELVVQKEDAWSDAEEAQEAQSSLLRKKKGEGRSEVTGY